MKIKRDLQSNDHSDDGGDEIYDDEKAYYFEVNYQWNRIITV